MLRRIVVLAVLDLKLYVRETIAVFWTFVFPFAWMVLSGVFLPPSDKQAMAYIIVPGLCTLVMITAGIMGSIFVLIYFRESRIYETIWLLGMNSAEIMIAQVLSRALLSFIQTLVLFVVGVMLFSLMGWRDIAGMLPALFLICFLGVGVFFNLAILLSLGFRSPPTGYWIATLLSAAMVVLGGCFYDPALLPRALSRATYYTPSYHVNELLRWAIGVDNHKWDNLFVLSTMLAALVLVNLCYYTVRHKHKQ